tara:strand:+ start:300 stop:1028 length:729 start_codon:yes stop_codon:yes gene_type:complete
MRIRPTRSLGLFFILLVLSACSSRPESGFKNPIGADKAYVVIGTGYRDGGALDISGIENIKILNGPLKLQSNFYPQSSIEFRRFDPETGESIRRPVLTANDPNGIFAAVGLEQSKMISETNHSNYNKTVYWLVEVNAGRFHLNYQLFHKGNKRTYIHALKNKVLIEGLPVFDVAPGDVAYIGDWLVAQGIYLAMKYPDRFGDLELNKLYLAHTVNFERMSTAMAGQGDLSKIRTVPIRRFTH